MRDEGQRFSMTADLQRHTAFRPADDIELAVRESPGTQRAARRRRSCSHSGIPSIPNAADAIMVSCTLAGRVSASGAEASGNTNERR